MSEFYLLSGNVDEIEIEVLREPIDTSLPNSFPEVVGEATTQIGEDRGGRSRVLGIFG